MEEYAGTRGDGCRARSSWARPTYVLLIVAGVALAAWLISVDALEWLYDAHQRYEALALDKIAAAVTAAGLIAILVLLLRERDLRHAIEERDLAEQAASRLERYDDVTGLPNRRLLLCELKRRVVNSSRHGATFALLFLDVDRFKSINDTYGHSIGDQLLQAIGERLVMSLRPQDLVARLGGDEFAILVNCDDEKSAQHIARRLLFTVSRSHTFSEIKIDTTVSIGIALFPSDADSPEALMKHADIAMYRAKTAGRNTFNTFDKDVEEVEVQIRRSLRERRFVPYYQPQVDLKTGRIVGLEALARWNHPTKGILGPNAFISFAEDAGLITELFAQILRRLCDDCRDLDPSLHIAVNLSPHQFRDDDLAGILLALLDQGNFPPERLEIELTESALVIDIEAARRIITAMKAAGVRVALDDFGTGYSSLSYLRELPFDTVKIDRSFVESIDEDEHSRKIIESIIKLSHALDFTTVAEGVGTKTQADWLRKWDCERGQGFLFARPVPAAQLATLLAGPSLALARDQGLAFSSPAAGTRFLS